MNEEFRRSDHASFCRCLGVRGVPARCEVRSATSGECGDCGFQLTGRLCSMHHERTSAFASAFSNRELMGRPCSMHQICTYCMYVSKHGAVHTHVCLSVSLSLCLFVCRPHGVYTRAHAPLCTCVYCIYICMYAHTYVCMYTRIMFVCKPCVCMHVCMFAWSHEWHTPNVRCDRCSDGRVLCTCLVVNVFRWRCMGLQGLGNRLRVVICERRISAVRPCLFLPLPRRAGCARKVRSAKRHFRRVRRLRLPAHGKAVQHAPRTDFCLCLCLLKQRAFSNTTARRAHVLCTCLVVNVFRRRCMGLQGLGNRLRVVICERRISAVRPCLFLPLPRRAVQVRQSPAPFTRSPSSGLRTRHPGVFLIGGGDG